MQNEAQSKGERLMLNPDIISFAQRYAAEISREPPVHTFEEIQRFCVDRGIIQDDTAENLSTTQSSELLVNDLKKSGIYSTEVSPRALQQDQAAPHQPLTHMQMSTPAIIALVPFPHISAPPIYNCYF